MIAIVGKRQITVPTGCEVGIVEFIGEQLDKGVHACPTIMAAARDASGSLQAAQDTSATITKLMWDRVLDYDGRTDSVTWAR